MIVPTMLLALALTAAPAVNAHGLMSLPKPTFAIQGDTTQFGLTVDSSALKAPSGMSFTTDPESNTKAFNAALKASSYKSVKELVAAKGVPIAGASKECGLTSATGAKQPLPAQVEWSHGSGEGFTPSHQGPCEVWCDNDLAFRDDNCAKNFPAAPAKLPYDKTKCAGKSQLKIIWLALHSPTWQAYINCAALEGGSASGGDDATDDETPATTAKPSTGSTKPSVTPKPAAGGSTKTPKPAATKTPAPATGGEYDEDCDDELPIAGDSDEDCDDSLDIKDTPMPTTKAPAAGGNNNNNGGSDEYATPAPATGGGEVGGDADEDCDDDLPIAGDADEDCDDELPVAGDEDCDEELDMADGAKTTKPKESVRTSDIEFDMLSSDDDVAAPVDY